MKKLILLSILSFNVMASPTLGLESSATLIKSATDKAVSELSKLQFDLGNDSYMDYIISGVSVEDVYTVNFQIDKVKNVEGFPEGTARRCNAKYSAENDYTGESESFSITCAR